MQIPLLGTYPVIPKNWKFSVTRFFLDILRLKVGSLQWLGPMSPRPNFYCFIVFKKKILGCHISHSRAILGVVRKAIE
jgi:hypothetical protein